MPKRFAVAQIDHVEVLVPNIEQAASWYERVLGLAKVANLPWEVPLMISTMEVIRR